MESSENKSKCIVVVSGELSGDIRGAALVRELKKRLSGFYFYGVGGDRMADEGVHLIGHVRDMAVVGIWEVFLNIKKILVTFRLLSRFLREKKPRLVILIDYPDFNLLIARRAKKRNIPVIYYISPQLWAWRGGRIKIIKKVVSKMLVLFPFEKKIYQDAGVDVSYVGHPLVDEVRVSDNPPDIKNRLGINQNCPIVAILPGSRSHEIDLLLPEMIKSARIIKNALPKTEFLLPLADTISKHKIEEYIHKASINIHIVQKSTYDAVSVADFAIVASGTATLEVALLGIPFVICYKVKPLTFITGKLLVNVPFIGLANIVAEREVAPELIQHMVKPEYIAHYALSILKNPTLADSARQKLSIVREKLGKGGAVEKVCEEVVSFLNCIGLKHSETI